LESTADAAFTIINFEVNNDLDSLTRHLLRKVFFIVFVQPYFFNPKFNSI